jgi:hypothetical protein
MRLLQVSHQRLEEFHDKNKTPEYAILSHTWIQPSHHEVSLQDLQDTDWTEAKQKQGWNKIAHTMNQAKTDGYEYIWIDTCCIDQRNPTELSTSINSMFDWYKDASVCYAYLDDVYQEPGRPANVAEALSKSRWTTRGWTLQELIAPSAVTFYDSKWRYLTSRRDSALQISEVTKIDIEVLTTCDGSLRLDSFSVAKRMSWAAERETTRPEDRAYSLFGLFDITMLTQYGEGEQRAFFRLQEEIVKISADQSLFAWDVGEIKANEGLLFAPSPKCFKGRGHITPSEQSLPTAFHMNNRGLNIEIQGFRALSNSTDASSGGRHQAILDCRSTISPSSAILINLNPAGQGEFCISPDTSRRCEDIDWLELRRRESMTRFLRRKITITRNARISERSQPDIRSEGPPLYTMLRLDLHTEGLLADQQGPTICAAYPPQSWTADLSTCQPKPGHGADQGVAARIRYRVLDSVTRSECTQEFILAFAYGPTARANPYVLNDPNELAQFTYPALPVLLAAPAKEFDLLPVSQAAGLEQACARVASMWRLREDPLMHTLPLVRKVQAINGTQLQIELDKAEIPGQPLWVAQLKLLKPESGFQSWISLCTQIAHWVVFLVIGWNIENSSLSHFIGQSLLPSFQNGGHFVLIFKIISLAVLMYLDPVSGLWSAIVWWGATHLAIQLNGARLESCIYAMYSLSPRALTQTDSYVYQFLRSTLGTTGMFRQWEFLSLATFVVFARVHDISWLLIAITIIRSTRQRDWTLLASSNFQKLRVLRICASWLLLKMLDGNEPIFPLWVKLSPLFLVPLTIWLAWKDRKVLYKGYKALGMVFASLSEGVLQSVQIWAWSFFGQPYNLLRILKFSIYLDLNEWAEDTRFAKLLRGCCWVLHTASKLRKWVNWRALLHSPLDTWAATMLLLVVAGREFTLLALSLGFIFVMTMTTKMALVEKLICKVERQISRRHETISKLQSEISKIQSMLEARKRALQMQFTFELLKRVWLESPEVEDPHTRVFTRRMSWPLPIRSLPNPLDRGPHDGKDYSLPSAGLVASGYSMRFLTSLSLCCKKKGVTHSTTDLDGIPITPKADPLA